MTLLSIFHYINTPNWRENIIQGVISGLIASTIFLFFLTFLRPSIKISDKISSQFVTVNGKTIHVFVFKIINSSFFFRLYDINISAHVCEHISNVNSTDVNLTEIVFKGKNRPMLNRLNVRHIFQNIIMGDKTLESRTDYAAQYITDNELATLLQNHSYIAFNILAKHSLSGFSRVKTMKYKHGTKIVKGTFLSGNSFRIVPDKNKIINITHQI